MVQKQEFIENKTVYCCNQMKKRLEDKSCLLRYDEIKKYYFFVRKYNYLENVFNFCPWCGRDLSEYLNNI